MPPTTHMSRTTTSHTNALPSPTSDVVKSRFQALLPEDRVARGYTSTLATLRRIYVEEGPRALYKGFVPKALRLGIGQTVREGKER